LIDPRGSLFVYVGEFIPCVLFTHFHNFHHSGTSNVGDHLIIGSANPTNPNVSIRGVSFSIKTRASKVNHTVRSPQSGVHVSLGTFSVINSTPSLVFSILEMSYESETIPNPSFSFRGKNVPRERFSIVSGSILIFGISIGSNSIYNLLVSNFVFDLVSIPNPKSSLFILCCLNFRLLPLV
jgi:hypothetical protein